MQKEDDEFAASVAARRSADISRTATPAAAEDTALIKSAEGRASERGEVKRRLPSLAAHRR